MTTVLCVLRSGGDFRPHHVRRLADQVERHAPPGIDFLCLTDEVEQVATFEVAVAPLWADWPGWFAKLTAFMLPGPCLYMDLDVNVVGDLAPLLDAAAQHEFVMCRGFWGIDDPGHVNSSVMAWRGDAAYLTSTFAEAPTAHMSVYSGGGKLGDQAFIRDHLSCKPAFWQDLLSGKVASFKRGALIGEDLSDCRVLCSHGVPRPWADGGADDWLARRARGLARGRSPVPRALT